jgi:hypothetical protein
MLIDSRTESQGRNPKPRRYRIINAALGHLMTTTCSSFSTITHSRGNWNQMSSTMPKDTALKSAFHLIHRDTWVFDLFTPHWLFGFSYLGPHTLVGEYPLRQQKCNKSKFLVKLQVRLVELMPRLRACSRYGLGEDLGVACLPVEGYDHPSSWYVPCRPVDESRD